MYNKSKWDANCEIDKTRDNQDAKVQMEKEVVHEFYMMLISWYEDGKVKVSDIVDVANGEHSFELDERMWNRFPLSLSDESEDWAKDEGIAQGAQAVFNNYAIGNFLVQFEHLANLFSYRLQDEGLVSTCKNQYRDGGGVDLFSCQSNQLDETARIFWRFPDGAYDFRFTRSESNEPTKKKQKYL